MDDRCSFKFLHLYIATKFSSPTYVPAAVTYCTSIYVVQKYYILKPINRQLAGRFAHSPLFPFILMIRCRSFVISLSSFSIVSSYSSRRLSFSSFTSDSWHVRSATRSSNSFTTAPSLPILINPSMLMHLSLAPSFSFVTFRTCSIALSFLSFKTFTIFISFVFCCLKLSTSTSFVASSSLTSLSFWARASSLSTLTLCASSPAGNSVWTPTSSAVELLLSPGEFPFEAAILPSKDCDWDGGLVRGTCPTFFPSLSPLKRRFLAEYSTR
mmetsp:Transcript_26480/g.46953  ORF Transcript_26480/g.46953 Transcript_26480/m.46953 type:complete len:269 (+) Transcript_26480:11-817(+)